MAPRADREIVLTFLESVTPKNPQPVIIFEAPESVFQFFCVFFKRRKAERWTEYIK